MPIFSTPKRYWKRLNFRLRHKATLEQVLNESLPITFEKFKGLLEAFNAIKRNGSKGRWLLELNGKEEEIRGPKHNQPVSSGTVGKTKEFLINAGVTLSTVPEF